MAGDEQVNFPAAPPVETTYLIDVASRAATVPFLKASRAMPAQFSAPHSPVANARVTARELAGALAEITDTKVCCEPVTWVPASKVFQFMLMPTSL